jgi:hypothetical protein
MDITNQSLYEGNDRPARIRIENRTPPLAGEVIYVHPPRSPAAHYLICLIHFSKGGKNG